MMIQFQVNTIHRFNTLQCGQIGSKFLEGDKLIFMKHLPECHTWFSIQKIRPSSPPPRPSSKTVSQSLFPFIIHIVPSKRLCYCTAIDFAEAQNTPVITRRYILRYHDPYIFTISMERIGFAIHNLTEVIFILISIRHPVSRNFVAQLVFFCFHDAHQQPNHF